MKKFESIIKFIKEIYPNRDIIPLHEPMLAGNELAYVRECIETNYVSSIGPFVDRFERMVEDFTGVKKAVVCVNGTNALYLSLILAGVKRDEEVITQPLTFIATANAISYCGASPVFIDVSMQTLGLSAEKLESFLIENTVARNGSLINKISGKKISACVPMHTFGHPVEIESIKQICDRFEIPLIEDAAESLGSTYKQRHTGTFGLAGILSFNGNKTVTTGGGGMILTNDLTFGQQAKHLTTQAKSPHPWEFIHDAIGYNYRMPNINAALGCAQMEQLAGFVVRKRRLAQSYKDFFGLLDISVFSEPADSKSNYWLNSVLLTNREERDDLLKITNEKGIRTRPAWRLMNELEMFRKCITGDLTNARFIADRIVNLPSSVPHE